MEITQFQGPGKAAARMCLQSVRLNAEAKGTKPKNTLSETTVALKQFEAFVNKQSGVKTKITFFLNIA